MLGLARSRLYANPKSTTRCDAATSLPFTKAEAFRASEETYLPLPSFRRISSLSLPLPFVSNNVINVIYKIERYEITSIFFFLDLETFEKKGKSREGTENIGNYDEINSTLLLCSIGGNARFLGVGSDATYACIYARTVYELAAYPAFAAIKFEFTTRNGLESKTRKKKEKSNEDEAARMEAVAKGRAGQSFAFQRWKRRGSGSARERGRRIRGVKRRKRKRARSEARDGRMDGWIGRVKAGGMESVGGVSERERGRGRKGERRGSSSQRSNIQRNVPAG